MAHFVVNLMPRFNPEFCFIHDMPEELGLYSSCLVKGEPLAPHYPADVRLRMSDRERGIELPDLIGNTCSLLICSARLKQVLESLPVSPVEFLRVAIYNHKKRLASGDYYFVNPLGVVDCLDPTASEIEYHDGSVVGVDKAVLDPQKVQNAPALFRMREEPTNYVVSGAVVRALAAMKPQPSNLRLFQLEQSGGTPT